eukprot:GILI01016569.1.p1 GENE.GILI01016569.1~~GILI01016569.1.p1  ORF type:complete len:157 (-),score=37.13 GILI01016569.1:251-688(-)
MDGGFFGEIALIYETKRTATIVARTYCDMFILTKDDFDDVKEKFPLQVAAIEEEAAERKRANQLKEQEKKEREAADKAAAAAKVKETIERNLSSLRKRSSWNDSSSAVDDQRPSSPLPLPVHEEHPNFHSPAERDPSEEMMPIIK